MSNMYITTPIYYVNDRPHIGHCYTTLVADCLARFHRARLDPSSVFFLTGTDEHADKVVTTAASHGLSPIAWADRNAEEFRKAFAFTKTSNDDFVRTTQERHKARVVEYVRALMDSGAIYKGTYEGWYDENQEEYVTETVAKESDFKSAVTGRPLVRRSEVCYFFALSRFQSRLSAHFAAHPAFIQPDARRNEVLGRLRDGLNDVPISRPVTSDPATQFGIRVPGDENHRIYVWIDALFNYLSIVDTDNRRRFWPTNVHFIAKDILWFHAVIWPAMLMALKDAGGRFAFVDLPGVVYSHAYWVRDGKKMSKSLGNFVTIEVLEAYASRFSLDALRWYLLTQGPLGATDADFSHAKFVEVYNTDLANGIGNCASRVSNMVEKYFAGKLPIAPSAHSPLAQPADAALKSALAACEKPDLFAMLDAPRTLIAAVDSYIAQTRPFTLAKDQANMPQVGQILADCAEAIRVAALLMSCAMPDAMNKLLSLWNCPPPANAAMHELAFAGKNALAPGHAIAKGEALFMRADPAEAPPA